MTHALCRIPEDSQTMEQDAVKLKLPRRSQNVSNARGMGYLLRKAANNEWNQPKRKKFVAVNKMKEGGDLKSMLTSDMEMRSLEFAQLVFSFVLV